MKPILHIPHSSVDIPLKLGYVATKEEIKNDLNLLTDHFTDELFENNFSHSIKAPFSRIFCDVERFRNDDNEVMAKYGMGVCYTHLDNGKPLRNLSESEREIILTSYYDPHHKRLLNTVDQQLREHNKALIIDCHSFPNDPHNRELDKATERTDICIGTDDFHTPKTLIKFSEKYFSDLGYSVAINSPFKGSIVPLKHYLKNENVHSIMIEVNRSLYLNNKIEKSDSFNKIKLLLKDFLKSIKQIYSNPLLNNYE